MRLNNACLDTRYFNFSLSLFLFHSLFLSLSLSLIDLILRDELRWYLLGFQMKRNIFPPICPSDLDVYRQKIFDFLSLLWFQYDYISFYNVYFLGLDYLHDPLFLSIHHSVQRISHVTQKLSLISPPKLACKFFGKI